MASNHIARINEDIRLCLSRKLSQVKDPRVRQGDLISVVRTETTGDLRYCKVYLSVLGEVDEKELRRGLRSCSGWLRRELGASLSLRYTPELIFELDHSIEHGAHINELISRLELSSDDGDTDKGEE
ncbi:MAG: 30S ribosome-binding factor RbfA [Oscillospiraceae bacterium]|nr:30S ribosome-binding factor RbfA [Oscillospiraceae bacterium]